ncbi:hypothetical protein IFR05_017317, partial [Cadophora sp. M221]
MASKDHKHHESSEPAPHEPSSDPPSYEYAMEGYRPQSTMLSAPTSTVVTEQPTPNSQMPC